MTATGKADDLRRTTKRGEQLCREVFKEYMELHHPGQFIALDTVRRKGYVAPTAEAALEAASREDVALAEEEGTDIESA